VAGFTEMCISPTEPLSYIAAEFTFELYVVKTMCGTILNASTYSNSRTSSTYQFFLLIFSIILCFFLIILTVFHSSKVRYFTLEAFVVR
jgi:hypothetical protein